VTSSSISGLHPPDNSKDAVEQDYFEEVQYPPKRKLRRQRLNKRYERLHNLHSYVARSGVVAVAASASMLTRQVEHMARVGEEGMSCTSLFSTIFGGHAGFNTTIVNVIIELITGLCCAIASFAVRFGEAASSLAAAFGEPPQSIWDDQDAPLFVFWAINLCGICGISSIVLIALSFFADTMGQQEEFCEPEALNPVQDNNDPALRLSVIFSLVFGYGVNLRHPLLSALLCGV
jgi:hypothetical protein